MPSLAELKTLVKNYKSDRPRLTAGKDTLLTWAAEKGLLKKEEPVVAAPVAAPKKVVAELPAVLRRKSVAAPEPEPEAPKRRATKNIPDPAPVAAKSVTAAAKSVTASAKKSSPFSAFMAANKGSGKSMKDLAAEYKAARE
jgi:hypothetical protein